jgi:hypothetical protein
LSPKPQKLSRFIATDWAVVEQNRFQLYGIRSGGINFACTETRHLREAFAGIRRFTRKEELATKVLKAYTKVKEMASKRYSRRKVGNSKWTPKTNDKVRLKTQPMSDVIKVTTSKFI